MEQDVHSGNFFVRFLREESGQDLVEYAILTAIVTVGGLALFSVITGKMETSYKDWGAQIQDGRFHPNDPIKSP